MTHNNKAPSAYPALSDRGSAFSAGLLSSRVFRPVVLTSASAVCLSFLATAGSADPLSYRGQAQYERLQSVSYEFGSKFTSGYFTDQAGKCSLTLMVTEKSSEDQPSPPSAARVRLVLNPGQVAGLDSEEGQSLNFTCGENAQALFVAKGERNELMALQNSSSRGEVTEANLH